LNSSNTCKLLSIS